MIETPAIARSEQAAAAVIHLTCPRSEIQTQVPPAIREIQSAFAAAGVAPAGPLFLHHLTLSRSQFDVEVGFPISAPFTASGRIKAGELPAARVARTIYHGPYEGLHRAWEEFGELLKSDRRIDPARLAPIKTLWERYLIGPETSSDPSQWRTELNLPLVG